MRGKERSVGEECQGGRGERSGREREGTRGERSVRECEGKRGQGSEGAGCVHAKKRAVDRGERSEGEYESGEE